MTNSNMNQNYTTDFLSLSLSTTATPPPQPPPPAAAVSAATVGPSGSAAPPVDPRTTAWVRGKPITIQPPHPWATTRRATAHGLHYLQSKGINTVSGEVQCKRCDRRFEVEYDLQRKFSEVSAYVRKNKEEMRQRAPPEWMNPSLPGCSFCGQEGCAKPVPSEKKKDINWVFLFLGQMIGCCKLAELKYFCKHTRNHRTGAKDRVLYLTYLEICRQLDPTGPYDS